MLYTIYNKNVPILDVEYSENLNIIKSVLKIRNQEYLPVALAGTPNLKENELVQKWWMGRSIPASRNKINDVLFNLDLSNTSSLVFSALGLSLSDQYWIKPKESDINWDAVNFFTNDFTDDFGELLLRSKSRDENIDLFTPNNTSDGWLQKKWTIIDGQRFLIKSGSGLNQEPFNEYFASMIHSRIGQAYYLPHELMSFDGKYFSACPCFIDENTELVTAAQILNIEKNLTMFLLFNTLSIFAISLSC